MKRLLMVGLPNSPHLHRWMRMISDPDLTVIVFPSIKIDDPSLANFPLVGLRNIDADLPHGTYVVSPSDCRSPNADEHDAAWNYTPLTHHFISHQNLASADRLIACIDRFQPDLLHSFETQIAGYLVAETSRRRALSMPWIHSTWGSDLALYGRMKGHGEKLRQTFRGIDLHLADCPRDRELARAYGYSGPELPIIPSSGGVDVETLAAMASQPPSRRRRIVVKGYHNWAGRNLFALSALVLSAQKLTGYEITVLNADDTLYEWAGIISNRTDLKVHALPRLASHEAVLAELAKARLLVSLGISDGLVTMVLEAMTLGAFPIQSQAGCSAEWFVDGIGGLSVPVNDTRAVSDAIIRAVESDDLVDSAAVKNLETIRRGWSVELNAAVAHDIYRGALSAQS